MTLPTPATPARQILHDLVTEEHFVGSGDPGIELYLRNKRRRDMNDFSPERTLLFVHGGYLASELTFDLPLDGISWADYIADRGWDVWLVDIRGYGRSTKPPEMELAPEEAPPVARTAVARADFGVAADFILDRRGISHLNALGWSWGTSIIAGWAGAHPDKAGRLALFGPAWRLSLDLGTARLPGYNRWTVEGALGRLQAGAPEDRKAALTPASWFAAWREATEATDDQAMRYDPPQVRSPAGALTDIQEAAARGEDLFDAQAVRAATLLVLGEWDVLSDRAGALALFSALTAVPEKRYVEIGGATHFAHLERRRFELYDVVQSFLEN